MLIALGRPKLPAPILHFKNDMKITQNLDLGFSTVDGSMSQIGKVVEDKGLDRGDWKQRVAGNWICF